METEQREFASRARRILRILSQEFPKAKCRLNHRDGLQLLVATILAAQCTDDRVNKVTEELFRRYRTATDYAQARQEQLEKEIRSTGFFHNKARSIIAMGRAIEERHGGTIPQTMEEMVQLPGVGRKTANVVLGNIFGKPAIVVDTHFKRVMGRVGLSKNTDPDKIEADVMKLLPEKDWTAFSYAVNDHGRLVCTAPTPKCSRCKITELCDYYADPGNPRK